MSEFVHCLSVITLLTPGRAAILYSVAVKLLS